MTPVNIFRWYLWLASAAVTTPTVYRDPKWRKQDPHGALRIHPTDAARYGLVTAAVPCESETGAIEVAVEFDDNTRHGFASLPHGYGA